MNLLKHLCFWMLLFNSYRGILISQSEYYPLLNPLSKQLLSRAKNAGAGRVPVPCGCSHSRVQPLSGAFESFPNFAKPGSQPAAGRSSKTSLASPPRSGEGAAQGICQQSWHTAQAVLNQTPVISTRNLGRECQWVPQPCPKVCSVVPFCSQALEVRPHMLSWKVYLQVPDLLHNQADFWAYLWLSFQPMPFLGFQFKANNPDEQPISIKQLS